MEKEAVLARIRPHHLPLMIFYLLELYDNCDIRALAEQGLIRKLKKLAGNMRNNPLGLIKIIAGQDDICKTPCRFSKDCAAGNFKKIQEESSKIESTPDEIYDLINYRIRYGSPGLEFSKTPAQRDSEIIEIYKIDYGATIIIRDLPKIFLYPIGEINL